MSRLKPQRRRTAGGTHARTLGLALLAGLLLGLFPLHAAADSPDQAAPPEEGPVVQTSSQPPQEEAGAASKAPEKASDEYGNVTEEEAGAAGPAIADPIEPWNRAMYHVNDKLYFWVWEPTARGYKYVVNEDVRGLFANFYRNVKAPVRIVNNVLQGKPQYAGIELVKFVINSTVGVGGLKDCATECFHMGGRDADFGQTLGKYGVGFGFYIVWPFLGPSSPRDTVGWYT